MAESGKPVPNEIIHASDVYSKQEVNDLIVDKTRSNLLRPILKTTTQHGITCTNNGDGTYTVNGTATDNAVFILTYVDRMSGYKLTGCPTNNSGSYLAIQRGSTDVWTNLIMDTGNGAGISLDTVNNPVIIAVEAGLTVDNIVFKPMITNDLSATYGDFVSYNDSFIMGINSGIGLDLLWTNANPSSAFPSQDIKVDTAPYKATLIEVAENTASLDFNTVVLLPRKGVRFPSFVMDSPQVWKRRDFTDRGTQIAAGISYNCSVNGSLAEDSSVLIPLNIWGIK